jgi:hypothetical protein
MREFAAHPGSGRIMKITNKLRFVERVVEHSPYTYKILQQWWENINTIDLGWTGEMVMGDPVGEWRDVPIEKENT